MGKPYLSELHNLEKTYRYVLEKLDISPLSKFIESSSSMSLFSVGSGGSFSAANFVALLHQMSARQFSKAVTPLDVLTSIPISKNSAYWFLSAGGKNTDINSSFKKALFNEPGAIMAMCAKTSSPLSQLANNTYSGLFNFDLPSQKDGFLATNTLIAFSLLSARAYFNVFSTDKVLPQDIWELLNHEGTSESYLENIRDRFLKIWDRQYFIVLHGAFTQPAAIDLESKFTEAALGAVLISDYRNFAHGRHHWLDKRGSQTAIIALITDTERNLAHKTIQLIPNGIPVVELDFPGNSIYSSLSSLITGLFITAVAGENRGIDPGQPGVPEFGRKLYHLGYIANSKLNIKLPDIAVKRKFFPHHQPDDSEYTNLLISEYKHFVKNIENQVFKSVVFDYDGTLCDSAHRFERLSQSIIDGLKNLLDAQVIVGIGTGRGKSVRNELQKVLPENVWNKVIIGYYNGAEYGLLSNNDIPEGGEISCPELTDFVRIIEIELAHLNLFSIKKRKFQVTIEPQNTMSLDVLWKMVFETANKCSIEGIKIFKSGHSIDILASGISKKTVITRLRETFGISSDAPVLCIGDCGQWPGNDFELLQEPYSLSVDEVSTAIYTCWNLAPAGFRGVQATRYYMQCMDIHEAGFTFKLKKEREIT